MGGTGERRTSRTLARYGDIMNLDGWPGADDKDRVGETIDAGANEIMIVGIPTEDVERYHFVAEEVLSAFDGRSGRRKEKHARSARRETFQRSPKVGEEIRLKAPSEDGQMSAARLQSLMEARYRDVFFSAFIIKGLCEI